MYDSERMVERVGITRSRLVWRDPATGNAYASGLIAKDPATLRFKMLAAGRTTIHIDADGNYFFDLDVLD